MFWNKKRGSNVTLPDGRVISLLPGQDLKIVDQESGDWTILAPNEVLATYNDEDHHRRMIAASMVGFRPLSLDKDAIPLPEEPADYYSMDNIRMRIDKFLFRTA